MPAAPRCQTTFSENYSFPWAGRQSTRRSNFLLIAPAPYGAFFAMVCSPARGPAFISHPGLSSNVQPSPLMGVVRESIGADTVTLLKSDSTSAPLETVRIPQTSTILILG